jgi:hypothetical protein
VGRRSGERDRRRFRGDVIIPVLDSQRNPAEELLADSYEAVSELNANAIGIATEKLTLEYDWFIRTDVGAVLLDQVAGNRFRKRSGFLRYAAHDGAVSSFGRNDGLWGKEAEKDAGCRNGKSRGNPVLRPRSG